MRHRPTIVVAAALALAAGSAHAGTISGSVEVSGARTNADVVVYIEEAPGLSSAPPAQPAVVNQRSMQFVPRILPVVVGTTVEFHNEDDVLHNVFTPSRVASRFNLGTWGKGQKRSYRFRRPGSAVLLCNVHPEMEAFVFVSPTPYFAKTDGQGRFAIEGVPAGTYTVRVWKEDKWSAEAQSVTVPAAGSMDGIHFAMKR